MLDLKRANDGSAFQPKNVDLLDRLQSCFVVVQGKELKQGSGRRSPFFHHGRAIVLGNPDLEPHRLAYPSKPRLNAVRFADWDNRLLGFHFIRCVTWHGDRNCLVSTVDWLGHQPLPLLCVLGVDCTLFALGHQELFEVVPVFIFESVQTPAHGSSPAHPRSRIVDLRESKNVPDNFFLDWHTFLDGKPNFRVDLEANDEGIVGWYEPRGRVLENGGNHFEHTCPAANLCDIADQTITDLKSPCRAFLVLSDTSKGAIGSSERLVCFWRKKVGVVVHSR